MCYVGGFLISLANRGLWPSRTLGKAPPRCEIVRLNLGLRLGFRVFKCGGRRRREGAESEPHRAPMMKPYRPDLFLADAHGMPTY